MNIATLKIDLVKKILNTEDEEVIRYINSIFDSKDIKWFERLPDAIKQSVEIGLQQAERNEGTVHEDYFKKYSK